PTAPDQALDDDGHGTGWRDPATGDPCIYVSRFDPAEHDFQPFVRYDIPAPTGDFANLGSAFLSALGVELIRADSRGALSAAEMSEHGGPRTPLAIAGLALPGLGFAHAVVDALASHQPFAGRVEEDLAFDGFGLALASADAAARLA